MIFAPRVAEAKNPFEHVDNVVYSCKSGNFKFKYYVPIKSGVQEIVLSWVQNKKPGYAILETVLSWSDDYLTFKNKKGQTIKIGGDINEFLVDGKRLGHCADHNLNLVRYSLVSMECARLGDHKNFQIYLEPTDKKQKIGPLKALPHVEWHPTHMTATVGKKRAKFDYQSGNVTLDNGPDLGKCEFENLILLDQLDPSIKKTNPVKGFADGKIYFTCKKPAENTTFEFGLELANGKQLVGVSNKGGLPRQVSFDDVSWTSEHVSFRVGKEASKIFLKNEHFFVGGEFAGFCKVNLLDMVMKAKSLRGETLAKSLRGKTLIAK